MKLINPQFNSGTHTHEVTKKLLNVLHMISYFNRFRKVYIQQQQETIHWTLYLIS